MKKIWLIDDDEDDIEIFDSALRTLTIKNSLIIAKNGEEALQQILSSTIVDPDYIFLDLNMPKMNGLKFLTALRQKKVFDGVPVFIYTTSSFGPDIDHCVNMGGKLVTKHSSFVALCSELKQLLA